jgi:hypothetical protein
MNGQAVALRKEREELPSSGTDTENRKKRL